MGASTTPNEFDSLVSKKFRFEPNEPDMKHFEVELVAVDRHEHLRQIEGDIPERKREPFSLLFRGIEESSFSSGMCKLVSEQYQLVDIFINRVMVGDRADPMKLDPCPHYEAVFA